MKRKLILDNKLSPRKTKIVGKFAKQIKKFANKNDFARLSIAFIGKDNISGNENEDYIDVTVLDKNSNKLLSFTIWE